MPPFGLLGDTHYSKIGPAETEYGCKAAYALCLEGLEAFFKNLSFL
jgi:hypothetical protein